MGIHAAASGGYGYNENPMVIEALMAAGADPNTLGKWGYTPLHRAAMAQRESDGDRGFDGGGCQP